MISRDHHVELNGVPYRLYESMEGHYRHRGEPRRPPNSVVVQGEGRQDIFQTRPDVLLWSLTDWSGGEGQFKYNPQESNRHAVLYNVEPFDQPGQLRPGPHFEVTQYQGGGDFARWDNSLVAPSGYNQFLQAFSLDATYEEFTRWDPANEYWVTVSTMAGDGGGVLEIDGYDVDGEQGYYGEALTFDIHAWDGALTQINTTGATGGGIWTIRELGDYVYAFSANIYKCFELPKAGTAFTVIDTDANGAPTPLSDNGTFRVAKGPNRLYVMLSGYDGTTRIREVIPSTAAATGYGREIARIPGFFGTSMWYSNGMLLMGGLSTPDTTSERILLYLIPGGDYGSLGKVRDAYFETIEARIHGQDRGGSLTNAHFILWGDAINPRVYKINTLTGGMAQLAELSDLANEQALPPVLWQDELFVASNDSGNIMRSRLDEWTTETSYALSPWHDMGLSEEKVLSSVILSTEEMPADWEVIVKYAKDGSATLATAGTYSTTSGTGATYAISTGGTSVTFRSLRIQIEFNYTGVGTPTTAPTVNSVQVQAQVASKVPVWELILDVSDDHGTATRKRSGSQKKTAVETLGNSAESFVFKDGYYDRQPSVYTEYDVVMDSFDVNMVRPGEGYAVVRLRSVAE